MRCINASQCWSDAGVGCSSHSCLNEGSATFCKSIPLEISRGGRKALLLDHFGRLRLEYTALQDHIRDNEDRCMHMRACGHATVYMLRMQAETEALLNGPLTLPALQNFSIDSEAPRQTNVSVSSCDLVS